MTTPESLIGFILLTVLAGSLLGSVRAFMSGPGEARSNAPGTALPADWPGQRDYGAPRTYSVAHAQTTRPRRFGLISLLMVFAIAYGASTAVFFSYNSPWSTGTDLRHLAASLHCSIAQRLDMAPAAQGQPGYSSLTDPDGNGVSCDPAGSAALVLAAAPKTRLSGVTLGWPVALTNEP